MVRLHTVPVTFADPGRVITRVDRHLVRAAGGSERFVLVELTAPTPRRDAAHRRPPVNIAFVLDRSGSMAGRGKLELAKAGVLEALTRLDTGDRFSVVVYDSAIDVVIESTPASAEARTLAEARLRTIEPRGSTDLSGGWLRGAEQVAAHLAGVDRVLLLTDGLANIGITDASELARHAAELRARGVVTSTIGVGDDYDEALLQAMADAGGGHYYFAGSLPEIRDHLTSEVGEALEVVARDVRLEIAAADEVSVSVLTPQPLERASGRAVIRLGDLVAGQLARVVLRARFAPAAIGAGLGATLLFADADGILAMSPAFGPIELAWRVASHAENDEQPRDRVVDRAAADLFAARARQEAVALNRAGDWKGARHVLARVADRVAGYAGDDTELRDLIGQLREVDAPAMSAPMPEGRRKQLHQTASNLSRTRDPQGRARRS